MAPPATRDPDALRARLLAWYDIHHRDLPWRSPPTRANSVREGGATGGEGSRTTDERARQPDPYRVWVAEVMLAQTQVDTVIPYYERFLDRFPHVAALAAADLDAVLKAWEGLGYYARARNLHRAARAVVEEHNGRLPRDAKRLLALPGIGPYTAAAIRSIAFGEAVLAVDGNVRRVVSRLHDLPAPSRTDVRAAAEALAAESPGDVNQALMDLGATICTPRSPRCNACPLADACLARARDTVSRRPGRRPRRPRPHFDVAVGVIWRDGKLLIAKRRPDGLLGGLWEFPGGKPERGERLEDALVREVREELGIGVSVGDTIACVDHAYSHFEVTLHAYHCRYRSGTPRPLGCADFAWVAPDDLDEYALPAANRRIIARLTRPAARASSRGWRPYRSGADREQRARDARTSDLPTASK